MVLAVYSPLTARSTRLPILLLAVILSGCASATPKPVKPAPSVSAEIDKAHAQEQQRQYHLARAHYQRAIGLADDPQSLAFAHREFASALLFWGEYASAQDELIASLEADATQIQAWHDLGILQARSGEESAAQASFERALVLAPKEPRTHVAIAALLVGMRDFREAEKHYQILLTLDLPPKIATAVQRAIALLHAEIAREASPAAHPAPQSR